MKFTIKQFCDKVDLIKNMADALKEQLLMVRYAIRLRTFK